MHFKRLVKHLRLKVKNKILSLKSNSVSSKHQSLKINEYNWISLSEYGDMKQAINEVSINKEIFEVVDELL